MQTNGKSRLRPFLQATAPSVKVASTPGAKPRPASATQVQTTSPAASKAAAPRLSRMNWLADRILDQLLEEQRAEIERSRNKHPEAGKTS